MTRPAKPERARAQLTRAERDAYTAGQIRPHHVDVRVHLLNRGHRLIEDISDRYVSGQSDLQDAAVMRTATATFADPHRDINDGDGFRRHHMIQAWSLVDVPTLPWVVREPVFCGPLTGKADDGETVSVTGEDKMMLALTDFPADSWEPLTLVVDVLTELFEATGETRIALPRGFNARIPDRVQIGLEEDLFPGNVAQRVAAQAGLQVYYDPEGWLRARELPDGPTHVYRTGRGGNVVNGRAETNEDWTDRPNRVLLRGGRRLIVTSTLPASDAHSPQALGRNNVPWRVTEVLENDDIKEKARGVQVTERTLRRSSRSYVDVGLDAVPARHVMVGDPQRLEDGRAISFVLEEASVPWGPGAMSVGYQRRVSKPPKRVRTKVVRRAKRRRRRNRDRDRKERG